MTYIIIEDEPNSRLFLQEMMALYFSEWKLLGVCSNVSEGIHAIKQLKPTLVLMDIEIGEGNGFDVLDAFPNPDFKVIFISGYAHYSLKAIKYAALDYILKPLNIEELRSALGKIQTHPADGDMRLEWLRNRNVQPRKKQDQLIIPSGSSYTVIHFDEINYLMAEGRYVYFCLDDNRKILASNSIGHYEKLFENSELVRVHKSYIVNLNKVARLLTKPHLCLELKDKTRVDIALRRKEFVIGVLNAQNNT